MSKISKIKPTLEFVTRDDRPNMIGICPVGMKQGAWWKKDHVEKYIAKIEKDLEFWRELLEQFDNVV